MIATGQESSQQSIEDQLRLIFFAEGSRRIKSAREDSRFRFSYYTSAGTGIKIIENGAVWLRNARLMNDYSEVHHGQSCLYNSWAHSAAGRKLRGILTHLDIDAEAELAASFDQDQRSRQNQTFILSVSEHGSEDVDENVYGRLSMWRAYGGKTNIAFVFKPDPFLCDSGALEAYTSPVFYGNPSQFNLVFESFVEGLSDQFTLLKKIGWRTLSPWFHEAFRSAVLSTKHPGFKEEREWRVLYSPHRALKDRLHPAIVEIDGTPQRIFKLPLKSYPDEGLVGMEPTELLDRVIIGPVEFPYDVRDAFVESLQGVGVTDAEDRVVISGIPLRR